MSLSVEEEEIVNRFINNFYSAAYCQGHISYLLMSIHAVNPNIFGRYGSRIPEGVCTAWAKHRKELITYPTQEEKL